MKQLIVFACFLVFVLSKSALAQNAIVGSGFSSGWGGSCPNPGNANFKYLAAAAGTSYGVTTTANGTGDQYFRFGIDWSGTSQLTITPGSDISLSPSTTYSLNTNCTTSGALKYNVTNASYNYIFKTLNAGPSPTGTFVFFEVQGTVRSVSVVAQSSSVVSPGQNIVITATLSGDLSNGQAAYLRYSNDNFSSSTVLLMSGSGSNYTATIPAGTNTAGANVKYYVFTSGSGATITHANADLYTINLNNNGGGNYSYTVATSWTSAGSGDWNTSGTWSSNEVPASNQSVTIDHAVTVNNAVTNAASTVSINPSKTLTFGGSGSLSATTLTNNGTVDMSSGGTLSIASGGTLSNNSTFTAGTGKVTFVAGATISGSSAITFNNVDVGGSVSMSSHTVNGTLTILNNTGSFVSSSPTYGAASTLKYTHSGDYSQITEWPSSNGPANVELAATSGGVTMQFSRSISGTLTLTSGKLTLGTNTLTMISGSSISGASSSTYIVTNSTGVLTINNVGATNTLFPIGTSSSYNPVTINNAGTADNFSARVSGSFDVAPNDPNSVLTRQWTITEANAGGSNATLTFQYNGTDPKGVLFTYGGPSKYIGRYTGTQWSATLATLGGSDPYTVTASGFTAFSPFAISEESSALPIQLSSFTGTLVNNRVRLDWTTISEVNNYGFYVEKRMSGSVDWWSIDGSFVAGHGTTSTPQHYSFTDNTLFSAATEYRLKQVDLDGTVHYTDPILVDRPTSVRESAPVQFALSQNYPNPFNPSTEIKFSVPATDRAKLVVFTALGQQVATLFDDVAEAGYYYKVRLDGSNLASGIYYYRLVSGKQSDLRKLVMVK